MNPAKTIQKNLLKFGDDSILLLWMNKDRTIDLNPRKIQNDPILPNPAKTVQKNLLKFAESPILPLWRNPAETIQTNPVQTIKQ